MAEYVGQGSLYLDLRPKRAAYLFRTGSRTEFCQAVARASSRWGGLQEPIVPVSSGGRIQPAWVQVLHILAPDVVFDVSGLSNKSRAAIGDILRADVLPVQLEDDPAYGAHPTVVDLGIRTSCAAADPSVGHAAGAGWLPTGDAGWREAGVTVGSSRDDVALAVAQLELRTIIEATATHCSEVYAEGLAHGAGVLWVASSNSLKDALWFWNIRALMPRGMGPRRAALVTPPAARSRLVGDAVHSAFGTPQKWSTPDLILLSLTLGDKDVKQIAQAMGLHETSDRRISIHLGATRDPAAPLTTVLNADPRQWLLGDRHPGLRTSVVSVISKPQTLIAANSAVPFGVSGGRVRARISGLPFLDVPRRKGVAELFVTNGMWKHGGLEVETDPLRVYQFNLGVPDHADVLAAALAEAQVESELSQPGRLADAVRKLVGASAAPLFSRPSVRKAIEALTTPRSRTLATEVAALASTVDLPTAVVIAEQLAQGLSRTTGDAPRVASGAGCKVGEAADALEQLTALGLAERGLAIGCGTCGLTSFVPFSLTTDEATFPACGATCHYKRTHNGVLSPHYRLNALLDRASDQGVLCHLAVAEQLGGGESSFLLLGANVKQRSIHIGEVDLLGFQSSFLLSGEMKTSAAGFTADEIRQAVQLAKVIRADVLVFGCTEALDATLKDSMLAAGGSEALKVWIVDSTGKSTDVAPPRAPSGPMT